MIPDNRPVLGKDLDAVRQQFGLLTSDACWLFGLSITRWTQIVRKAAELPVKDPTLALLVRFLDQHPELPVIPKFPTASEAFELINSVQETDQKRLSVLFGSEASAAYRWLRGGRQSPAVNRLMHFLKLAMLAHPFEKRAEVLDEWSATVVKEAEARKAPDIFKTGKWNPKGVAEASAVKDAATPEITRSKPKKGRAASAKAGKAT